MSYQIVLEVANNGISGTIERVVVHKNFNKKFVYLVTVNQKYQYPRP